MPSDESPEVRDAPRVTATLACPCGCTLVIFDPHDEHPAGWATIANRDELGLLDFERRGRTTDAAGICGSMHECPDCGRLLWQRPGANASQVCRPDPDAPKVHPEVNGS